MKWASFLLISLRHQKLIMNQINKICLITLVILSKFINAQSNGFQFDNFSTDNGLSDHYVTSLYQDKLGWIWIGTGMGIERFDGINFRKFVILNTDGTIISDFLVRDFFEDDKGKLFVGIEEFGLAVFNRETECFERLTIQGKPVFTDVSVKCIAQDSKNNYWLSTKKGLQMIGCRLDTIVSYMNNPNNNSISSDYVRKVVIDNYSAIWIATQNGLDKFVPSEKQFIHYKNLNPLLGDDILEISLDQSGKVWVGTGSNGVFIIKNEKIEEFNAIKPFERSNKVNCILQETSGNVWIGTRGGLFSYDLKNRRTVLIQNDPFDKKSLAHNSIMDIMQDHKGDIWVASRGGISYMVKEKQVFKNYFSRPSNNHFLNNSEIYCIRLDKNNNIWMGTESGGVNILNHQTGEFQYLTKENGRLTSNCIKVIASSYDENVLIGTFEGGLNTYNNKTGQIVAFAHDPKNNKSISSNVVWDICLDRQKRIWVGTANGLDRFDPVNRTFEHYPEFTGIANGVSWIAVDSDEDIWLGSQKIYVFKPGTGITHQFDEQSRDMFIDSKGNIWIMTSNKGIAKYDKQKGAIKYYNKDSGLPSNLTYCMLEDKSGKLWISTANGLACFDQGREIFKTYYNFDGTQGNQFHYGASCQDSEGKMYFGGINGMTVFSPEEVIQSDYSPPVYLTDFKIFGQSVKVEEGKDAILKKSISIDEQVVVPYKFNVLTFEFAALNYTNSHTNTYKYILEGFDENWNVADGSRKASYTNLNPGTYIFKVKASKGENDREGNIASVHLIVLPPFYMKTWFISLAGVIIISVIAILFVVTLRRREQKKNIEFERIKAKKLHELDAFKLSLFTNLSHEIKTPLTLIISPLKKLIKGPVDNESLKENLHLMEKNANQLMDLVIQLLDYRKLQEGKLQLELKRGNIVQYCEGIFHSFRNYIEEKELSTHFDSVPHQIFCYFDAEKLRKVLNNLISNAIRYNKRGGELTVIISTVFQNKTPFVKIEVKDTGIGIFEKLLPKIFDKYFSDSRSDEFTSTGIGLAFAKELIDLQNGIIHVTSKPGEGSIFTLLIPLIEDDIKSDDTSKQYKNNIVDFINSKEFFDAQKTKKILLLIEDNEDVRGFIRTSFKDHFIVLEAENGREGIDLAIKTIPDMIMSDVMMPGISGFELCNTLKNDERTSHIPIILLTALSSEESIKKGLELGADDYITKPFDVDILRRKVDNHLNMRKALIEKYSKQLMLNPGKITVKTPDEKFLEKTVKLIEEHMDDSNLNVETFVQKLGVSRMQLYRKTEALTNMTVKELVTDIRLKRAEQLIRDNNLTVSDVAYRVGFNDLSYFGKCFKKKYNMSPSEFIKNLNN